MTTILVGVDASDRSDDAIALAQDLASTTGSRIVLAAAAPYPAGALPGETAPPQLADEVVRETEHMLAGKAAALEGTGIEVECVTNAFISPPHLLQSLADAEPADLVVVGSTGTGRAGRVLPGSTGERLLHGAPCPVAVAPAGYRDGARRPPRRIGVALDGSDESRAALQAGVVIASRLGGELEVVTVLHLLRFGAPAAMGGPGYDRTPAQMEATALQRLEAVVTGLPPTVRGTTRLLVGDPVEQLAQHSTELDLLLVGSRGYGPLRAVLLGGVSGRPIRRAACPVIVTPRGVDRPLTDAFASLTTAAAGP
jgi:nucleotide-binding universal stress UspA family protein